MQVGEAHLSYCTNIHPGETWAEVDRALRTELLRVRARVAPEEPFGVGLRLSAQAAEQLSEPAALERFLEYLSQHQLYVFTLNGFPYGRFHGAPVKAAVYRPDWSTVERGRYTQRLAELSAAMTPKGRFVSISTVPGAYAAHVVDASYRSRVADNLIAQVAGLHRLRADQSVHIGLALEPEPGCMLETTSHIVSFFEQELRTPERMGALATSLGITRPEAEAVLGRHLGVCLDTCHAAVEFETPESAIETLRASELEVMKVQLSAGLRVLPPDESVRERLRSFDEPVYLHQTVARMADGALLRFSDLPEALNSPVASTAAEWRVHFHVPIHAEVLDGFSSTQQWLQRLLRLHRERPVSQHLEVETYTWDVLPPHCRSGSVAESIARELQWVLAELTR